MAQQSEADNTEKATPTAGPTREEPNGDDSKTPAAVANSKTEEPERDEFGLPIKRHAIKKSLAEQAIDELDQAGRVASIVKKINEKSREEQEQARAESRLARRERRERGEDPESDSEDEQFTDARSTPIPGTRESTPAARTRESTPARKAQDSPAPKAQDFVKPRQSGIDPTLDDTKPKLPTPEIEPAGNIKKESGKEEPVLVATKDGLKNEGVKEEDTKHSSNTHTRGKSSTGQKVSEWSHQQVLEPEAKDEPKEEDEWQEMPAYAPYDIYDDDNKLIAREVAESDDGKDPYAALGGAGKGYTRVQLEEDAQSATSLDENTQYLFKDVNGGTGAGEDEDEETRDALSQMQATKNLLTEGQKVAYVGMTRLVLAEMLEDAEKILRTRGTKKNLSHSAEAMKMWSQKMMIRLYSHMDISTAEQIMVEQLAEHGVIPADLTPTLMQNSRVKNPMAEKSASTAGPDSPGSPRPSTSSPRTPNTPPPPFREELAKGVPPPYEQHTGEDLPQVQLPSQLPKTANLDIDLRWTVLCDLFLVLISDSIYDARSRVLLENVGKSMAIDWIEICRFEKRVTDALEMQQAAEKENWNEDEHKETRRKAALNKRYVMMGLATVGGGLVIGLSAGLLAPLIGAGLAAGFTTIGVAGTSGFLAGAGGAAIITSAAATSGGVIAVRAANRRTGAVKTFEYRPLHNNKRVNLIITVSGWMTGKVDDVRLPYSTVDPVMGDIYSVLWEPEMLRSMGDTINILATEALTSGLQQVLGSTILMGLMAALQLPVVLTKLSYLIDNPWSVSLDRANMAGLILADSLIDRNLGTRPVTLVGYSIGSRVIFSCLQELARKGAYGLVQNVYLFGSPIVAKRDEYLKARTVVAGRFVNGYATNDWILGYLFRLTSGGISRVAGLAPVENIQGFENLNVTDLVPGHMAYRTAMPRLLREAGWMVESDEFTEIEDPDPENHAQRQRELINEIEEARKEFEKEEKKKGGKGKFSLFGRKKKNVQKKEWETYQETKVDEQKVEGSSRNDNEGVLFDVDAIRAELANQEIEVRELPSTLPPMKLDIEPSIISPREPLRMTRSFPAPLPASDFKSSTTSSPLKRESYDEDVPPARNLDDNPRRRDSDEIQMTFDTSFHSPPRSTTPSYNNYAATPEQSFSFPPREEAAERAAVVQRPELKSSTTTPVGLGLGYGYGQPGGMDLERNAWADDDDDEFGQEKEISMTFA